MYASITTGVEHSKRTIVKRKSELDGAKYKPTILMCGLQKYEELPTHYIGYDLYHYFDNSEPLNDVHISCAKKACRLNMVFESSVAPDVFYSVALNGIPLDSVCEWRDVSTKIKKLIKSFNH